MQEDTYRGDGLNLYAYCGNNPVRYYDPSGHQGSKKCKLGDQANYNGQESAGEGGGSSGTKPTSQNQMQKQVESGRAPKVVDRVDPPHTSTQQPYIHFGDNERGLNMDGTWHDDGKNIPNITNKIAKWIVDNGWNLPKK